MSRAPLSVIEKQSAKEEASRLQKRASRTRNGRDASSKRIAELETEVAVYRQALEKAREEMQSFAYSVSHDLRAPLRAIEGFSKILVEDFLKQLTPDAARFLQHIISNSQQLAGLVDDLLKFYRATKNPPNRTMVDANAACREAIRLLAPSLPPTVTLEQDELPQVFADPTQLRQIFEELVGNALKFTAKKDSPRIEIRAVTEPGVVTFTISDNGDGFDPKNSSRLFNVFQKLHNANYAGNGIGLAIVKRLVEANGGCVSATGIQGKGAKFSFSLRRTELAHPQDIPSKELIG